MITERAILPYLYRLSSVCFYVFSRSTFPPVSIFPPLYLRALGRVLRVIQPNTNDPSITRSCKTSSSIDACINRTIITRNAKFYYLTEQNEARVNEAYPCDQLVRRFITSATVESRTRYRFFTIAQLKLARMRRPQFAERESLYEEKAADFEIRRRSRIRARVVTHITRPVPVFPDTHKYA